MIQKNASHTRERRLPRWRLVPFGSAFLRARQSLDEADR
jgi:hypothetical protein